MSKPSGTNDGKKECGLCRKQRSLYQEYEFYYAKVLDKQMSTSPGRHGTTVYTSTKYAIGEKGSAYLCQPCRWLIIAGVVGLMLLSLAVAGFVILLIWNPAEPMALWRQIVFSVFVAFAGVAGAVAAFGKLPHWLYRNAIQTVHGDGFDALIPKDEAERLVRNRITFERR